MAKGEAAFVRSASKLGDAVDRFRGEVPILGPTADVRITATAEPQRFAPAEPTVAVPAAVAPGGVPLPQPDTAPAPAAVPPAVPAAVPLAVPPQSPVAETAPAAGGGAAATTALAAAKRTVNSGRTHGNGHGPVTESGTGSPGGPSNSTPSNGVSAHRPKTSTTLAAWSAAIRSR